MSSLDQLPYEILFSIVVESSVLNTRDIYHLLLVNRHLKTTLRPFLFRTLDLSTTDSTPEWTTHNSEHMEGWGPYSAKKAKHASAFLMAIEQGYIRTCDIAAVRYLRISQIHRLVLCVKYSQNGREWTDSNCEAQSFLYQHLTNLRVLELWGHCRISCSRSKYGSMQGNDILQQIPCRFDIRVSTNSKSLLCSFPQNHLHNLVSLEYDHSGGPQEHIASKIRTAKNLKTLRLANINPWSSNLNEQIVDEPLAKRHTLSNLRELYLIDCKPNINCLPESLQILSISFFSDPPTSDSWMDDDHEDYWSAIFNLRNLRSLSIRVNYDSNLPPENPDREIKFRDLESLHVELPLDQPKAVYEVQTSILLKILRHNAKLKDIYYSHIPSTDLLTSARLMDRLG